MFYGRADLLRQMQDMVLADAANFGRCQPVVVYLGDYIDRGLDLVRSWTCCLTNRYRGSKRSAF